MLESLRWYLRAHKYKAKVEPQEIDFVIQHVRKGQVAVDIGAYKGAFVYWMQRMVGPAGRVFAFEPQPRLAQYLRRLFRDRPNICVEQFALSDHVGHADLFVPVRLGRPEVSQLASLQDSWEGLPSNEPLLRVRVELTTLDHYFSSREGRPVGFLKCDAEGHELHVFRGGKRILREDRPVLLFECDSRLPQKAAHVLSVFDFLQNLGYCGFFFDRRRNCIRSITEGVIERHYSHNFAFLPRQACDVGLGNFRRAA